MREFGEWIWTEEWENISENISSSEQVLEFENIISTKFNSIMPQKSVKLNPFYDKPYITSELKKLDRRIKRTYRKHGKSENYNTLKIPRAVLAVLVDYTKAFNRANYNLIVIGEYLGGYSEL